MSAILQHYPLNLPAFMGLNKQAQGAVLGPEWATRLENTVLDASNRVAARKGWSEVTTAAMGSQIVQLVEYDNSGTMELIATLADNTIYKSTNDGATWSAVTGTATVSDPNMQFVTLASALVGFQSGATAVVYTGTTFSDLSGSPTGGAALAAFGRIWAKSSATAFKYCGLLDHTDWVSADTGTFDLNSVWKDDDEIVALAEFNGALAVFGNRNIVIFTDGSGSALGLDPLQAYVVDTVGGIGCYARDSVVNVKGDLWFLDATGIHSLGRLLTQKSNPIQNISRNVQDALFASVTAVTATEIRAAYSPKDRLYLLSLPSGTGTSENGLAYAFDTRAPLEDGAYRCVGVWNSLVPKAMVVRKDLTWVIARRQTIGSVGLYAGNLDDADNITIEYESGWTDLGNPNLKILKRVRALLFTQVTTSVVFKWAFDFDDTFKTATVSYSATAAAAEFNIAEFNIAEFGGGLRIQDKKVAGRGTGEYIKLGFTANTLGGPLACQQITAYAKQGRLK